MDPIADFLTIIRNGYLAKKEVVSAPLSKIKVELCKILAKHGYILSYSVNETFPARISMALHYLNEKPILTSIDRVSVPGVRRYSSTSDIHPVRSGAGITIISTSRGLMTDKQAKKEKLGGEVICRIW